MTCQRYIDPARRWRGACIAVAVALMVVPSLANASGDRTLLGLDAERTSSGWTVELRFAEPLRYMGHSPRAVTDSVRIELRTLGLGRADESAIVPSPPSRPFGQSDGPPIVSVESMVAADGQGLEVELRFSRPLSFEVQQDSDLQRLALVIRDAASTGGAKYEAAAASLLEAAKQSMAANDPSHAAQLYTRVLSMNAPAAHPEALEMLGLARERMGQRAHAKAEYEAFLERYPDDKRASRVRQRLRALTTADTSMPDELAPARRDRDRARVDVHGSALSYYSRAQGFYGDLGSQLYDSSWINDLYARARVRTDRLEVTTSAGGRIRLDFTDDELGSDSRLNDLLVEVSERGLGWWGNVGRQRGDGGVTGRFDGARLGYQPTDRLDFQVYGGFPLATYSSNSINTARFQVGGAGQVLDLFSLVDVEVYGNYQHEAGMTYRGAIGTQIRHLRAGRTLVGTLDYDVYFNSVNIASLLGNQQVTDSLSLNALIEYRKSPIVTMGNALIGQQATSLEELTAIYTTDEIKQLAEDRSANSTTMNFGGRWNFNDRMDVSGTFTISRLGSTEESPGVPALPSTGWDFGYFGQFGIRNVFMERDVTTFGVRIFQGEYYDRYVFETTGSYPVLPRLRLNPILRFDYQNGDYDFLRIVPRLRLSYFWRDLSFDLDFAYDFTSGVGDADRPTEQGYSLIFGARFDF
jgi:tetratricopeptide (TPR) repeat protein